MLSTSAWVALEGGVGDDPEADAVPLADLDRIGDLVELPAGLLLDPPLDAADQLLGLVVVAVDEQPAGALGDVAPDQQDAEAEHGPRPKASRQPRLTGNRSLLSSSSDSEAPNMVPSQNDPLIMRSTRPQSRAGISSARPGQPVQPPRDPGLDGLHPRLAHHHLPAAVPALLCHPGAAEQTTAPAGWDG